MELTDVQQAAVKQWVAEGCGLSEVQRRLADEFGLKMTFMDVRFLVLDLGVAVKDKPDARNVKPPAAADDGSALPGAEADGDDFPAAEPGGGAVSVTLDRIVQPGAVVSGSVSFSDGVKATWALDQFGRLSLNAGTPGYRPPESDLHEFQVALQQELQKQGY